LHKGRKFIHAHDFNSLFELCIPTNFTESTYKFSINNTMCKVYSLLDPLIV
jgi:hypothetical protein